MRHPSRLQSNELRLRSGRRCDIVAKGQGNANDAWMMSIVVVISAADPAGRSARNAAADTRRGDAAGR